MKNKILTVIILAVFTFTPVVMASSKEYVPIEDSVSMTVDKIKIKSLHFVDNTKMTVNNFGLIAEILNPTKEDLILRAKISYYDEKKVLLYSSIKEYAIDKEKNNALFAMLDKKANPDYDSNKIVFYSVDFETKNGTLGKSEGVTDDKCTNEDYIIEDYKYTVIVKENNTNEVTETFKAHYNEEDRTTKRTVPIETVIKNRDGSQSRYSTKILSFQKQNDLSVRFNMEGKVFTFDDIDEVAKHTLTYSYQTNSQPPMDFVDLHISYDHWNSCLKNVEFSIEMPKDFDLSKLQFTDGEGKDKSSHVTVNRHENTIVGQVDDILKNEDIHITLFLDDDYFDEQKIDWTIIAAFALPTTLVVFSFVIWFFFGRDDKLKIGKTSKLPKGDLLEIRLALNGSLENEDVALLIIALAKEGYLKIKKVDKNSKRGQNRYEIIKLCEYRGQDEMEKRLFDDLFKDEVAQINENILKTNYDKGKASKKLKDIRSVVIDTENMTGSLADTAEEINELAENKFLDRIFEKSATILGKTIWSFGYIILLSIFVMPTIKYGNWEDVLIIICALFIITIVIKEGLFNCRNIKLRIISLIIIFTSLLVSRATPIWETCLYEKIYVYSLIWGLTCVFVNHLIKEAMPKRTTKGNELTESILGFKSFFTKGKSQNIEKKLQDSDYFEEALAYIYAVKLDRNFYKSLEKIEFDIPNYLENIEKDDLGKLLDDLGLLFIHLPELERKDK